MKLCVAIIWHPRVCFWLIYLNIFAMKSGKASNKTNAMSAEKIREIDFILFPDFCMLIVLLFVKIF